MERVSPQIYKPMLLPTAAKLQLSSQRTGLSTATVGQPIWAVLLKIVDEHNRKVSFGQPGEIFVRTPMAIDGYYRNPEATKEFFSDGWCGTGDIGLLDDEGYLHISGRKKSMIKSAGISIFPEEIEVVLRAHADVAEVAVVACRHPEWGESVKALVIPKTGAVVRARRYHPILQGSVGSI